MKGVGKRWKGMEQYRWTWNEMKGDERHGRRRKGMKDINGWKDIEGDQRRWNKVEEDGTQ